MGISVEMYGMHIVIRGELIGAIHGIGLWIHISVYSSLGFDAEG